MSAWRRHGRVLAANASALLVAALLPGIELSRSPWLSAVVVLPAGAALALFDVAARRAGEYAFDVWLGFVQGRVPSAFGIFCLLVLAVAVPVYWMRHGVALYFAGRWLPGVEAEPISALGAGLCINLANLYARDDGMPEPRRVGR